MASISVIIPCYNAQDYIDRCLDSLDKQTFKDFDIIIVNDCSTDHTLEVVNKWVSKHGLPTTILSNKENVGPSLSRFCGANLSRSKWVTFCDSDDWYEENYLEAMIDKAESDECDIVFCGYQNISKDIVDKHPLINSSMTLLPKEGLKLNVDSLCMTLVKRDIFISCPQVNIRNGEDMALIPLLTQSAKRIGALNDILYNYYLRPGSASLTPNKGMIDSLLLSFSHIRLHMREEFREETEFIGIRNVVYGCLLNLFKYSHDTQEARLILESFEQQFPRWYENPNISNLTRFKRLYLNCAKRRLFPILFVLSNVHSIMIRL